LFVYVTVFSAWPCTVHISYADGMI